MDEKAKFSKEISQKPLGTGVNTLHMSSTLSPPGIFLDKLGYLLA